MPRRDGLTRPFRALTLTIGLAAIIALGGCPVAQQPTTPPADDGNTTNDPSFLPNNSRDGVRPIPPIPVDTGNELPDAGNSTQTGSGAPTAPDLPDEPDETPQTPSLRVIVLGPNNNLEVRRDEPVEIEYRVDGDSQGIELIYDVEGGQSGVVAQSGLNVEGTVVFETSEPGVYSFSIRATGSDSEVTQVVPGSVTVVGDMR